MEQWRRVHNVGVVDFFTDDLITSNTDHKGIQRAKYANNADLWVQLFQDIEAKNLIFRVYWMPSHTDTKPSKEKLKPTWMQEWHVKGNSKADSLAIDAAAFHTISHR